MMLQRVFSEAFFSASNATYFTVRSRALAALIGAVTVIAANFLLGFLLDWRRLAVHTRAVAAFILVYAFEVAVYIYAMVKCKELEGRAGDLSVQRMYSRVKYVRS